MSDKRFNFVVAQDFAWVERKKGGREVCRDSLRKLGGAGVGEGRGREGRGEDFLLLGRQSRRASRLSGKRCCSCGGPPWRPESSVLNLPDLRWGRDGGSHEKRDGKRLAGIRWGGSAGSGEGRGRLRIISTPTWACQRDIHVKMLLLWRPESSVLNLAGFRCRGMRGDTKKGWQEVGRDSLGRLGGEWGGEVGEGRGGDYLFSQRLSGRARWTSS